MTAEADYTEEVKYVQAAPGYDVLLYVPATKTFESHPVCAWAILHGDENFICAQPITCMSWSVNDDRSVRMPSGEVVCDARLWPNAETWLAEMKANDGVPLAAEDVPSAAAPDDAPPDITAPVLALDSFRNRFRGP